MTDLRYVCINCHHYRPFRGIMECWSHDSDNMYKPCFPDDSCDAFERKEDPLTPEERVDKSYKLGYADGYRKAENDYHAKAKSECDKAFKAGLEIGKAERDSGEWVEKQVFNEVESSTPIEKWQSAKCSVCGKYHTTPYLYYFTEYDFCPHCGSPMKGEQ